MIRRLLTRPTREERQRSREKSLVEEILKMAFTIEPIPKKEGRPGTTEFSFRDDDGKEQLYRLTHNSPHAQVPEFVGYVMNIRDAYARAHGLAIGRMDMYNLEGENRVSVIPFPFGH